VRKQKLCPRGKEDTETLTGGPQGGRGGPCDSGALKGTLAGMEGVKASSRNKMYFKYFNTDKYLLI